MFKPTDSAKDSEKHMSTLPNQLKRIINTDSEKSLIVAAESKVDQDDYD